MYTTCHQRWLGVISPLFTVTGQTEVWLVNPGTGAWGLFSTYLSVPFQPSGRTERKPLGFPSSILICRKQVIDGLEGWRDENKKKNEKREEIKRRALEQIHTLTLMDKMEIRAELKEMCLCAERSWTATFRLVLKSTCVLCESYLLLISDKNSWVLV